MLGSTCSAAAGTGRGVEVARMDHGAVGRILQMNIDGIADPDADEGARHLTVEGPVAERGAFGESLFDFNAE